MLSRHSIVSPRYASCVSGFGKEVCWEFVKPQVLSGILMPRRWPYQVFLLYGSAGHLLLGITVLFQLLFVFIFKDVVLILLGLWRASSYNIILRDDLSPPIIHIWIKYLEAIFG